MSRGIKRFALISVSLLILQVVPAAAQVIRGRVVSKATQAPLRDVLVELRAVNGDRLQSFLTNAQGGYRLSVSKPGRYVLRVAAIGYGLHPLEPLDVGADGLDVPDVVMAPLAIRLPDLVGIGQSKSCGQKRILSDDLFGRFLNSVHAGLDVVEAAMQSHAFAFQAITVHTQMSTGVMRADTSVQFLTKWPIEASPADPKIGPELGRIGGPSNALLQRFYGIDPSVVFSEWFLESHCWQLQKVVAGSDTVRIKFTPIKKSARVDVSGELALRGEDLALMSMTFHGENLPTYIDKRSAGGEIRFAPIRSGLWIPIAWTIWAPVQGSQTCLWRTVGLNEIRGAVQRVVAADGSPGVTFRDVLIPRQAGFDHERCLERASPIAADSGR